MGRGDGERERVEPRGREGEGGRKGREGSRGEREHVRD